MRIVPDTNILLVSVSRKSESHWLFEAFEKKKFELAFTTEMLAEYEEQFSKHWDTEMANDIVDSILNLPNAIPITVYYHLNLITYDKDDNKFADCAFASNATYSVTNDSDFNILKKIDFPFIRVVSLNELRQILISENLLTL